MNLIGLGFFLLAMLCACAAGGPLAGAAVFALALGTLCMIRGAVEHVWRELDEDRDEDDLGNSP